MVAPHAFRSDSPQAIIAPEVRDALGQPGAILEIVDDQTRLRLRMGRLSAHSLKAFWNRFRPSMPGVCDVWGDGRVADSAAGGVSWGLIL
jgi:hypothetical protein